MSTASNGNTATDQRYRIFANFGPAEKLDAVLKAKAAGTLHYAEDRAILGLPTSSDAAVLRRLLALAYEWQDTCSLNARRLRDPDVRATIGDGELVVAFEQLAESIAAAYHQARTDAEVED